MAKLTLKKRRKIFKVCLTIFELYASKGLNRKELTEYKMG